MRNAGVIWCLKFSKNGKYVATAGQDGVIRVWEVVLQRGKPHANGNDHISSAQSSRPRENHGAEGPPNGAVADQSQETSTLYEGFCSDCPVLSPKPYRVYQGHKQDVLELCWSKSQFVLSASMDKTVKLWHLSMDECLRTFK